jgi:hypothetical protein
MSIKWTKQPIPWASKLASGLSPRQFWEKLKAEQKRGVGREKPLCSR